MHITHRHPCLLLLLLHAAIIAGHGNAAQLEKKSYIVYMGDKPDDVIDVQSLHANLLDKAIGSSSNGMDGNGRIVHSYTKSFSGFAAMLTEEEAKSLSDMDEVTSVFPNKRRRLHTTRSWNFMGFPTTAPRERFESDVIVGMIDTGIWPESRSFNDGGFGPPQTKWKGTCQTTHNFTCNNKIIGGRYYRLDGKIGGEDIASPRDNEGHGTHTASTAAGRAVGGANLAGLAMGTARGGVPSARIAVYKVCWNDGCFDADLLAAFDDAIADGVDIISISIGGDDPVGYFKDPIAIGSFHAMRRGILTTASAGNSGPVVYSVENYAPWMLTVAASTIDRKIVAKVELGDGRTFQGMAINTHGMDGKLYPFMPFSETMSVEGKVVLCDIVDQINPAVSGGAVGAIVAAADGANDVSFEFPFPAAVVGPNDFSLMLRYANTTSNPTATIHKSKGAVDAAAPYVASFSSRGPNPITYNVLKPDMTAPGVGILAAWSPISAEEASEYNIISGTSMACPHVSGAAAYVKSFHPTWSPGAIKSALMTTALPMSAEKNEEAELAYGAGHVNPIAALEPGLVYDAEEVDYVKMLCGEGYKTEVLRHLTGDKSSCTSATNGTVFDLNYPSFALSTVEKHFSATYRRNVTNVGDAGSTYKALVSGAPGLRLTVEPDVLTFGAQGERQAFVLKVEGEAVDGTLSGALTWSDGKHRVRSPIAIYLA